MTRCFVPLVFIAALQCVLLKSKWSLKLENESNKEADSVEIDLESDKILNISIDTDPIEFNETTTADFKAENNTGDSLYHMNLIAPSDSYAQYKKMMEKDSKSKDKEPVIVTTVKEAFKSLLEAALKGLLEGFLPHVDRQRREAPDDTKSYLDIAIGLIGALLGRQECSEVIACRSGKYVGDKVPGASLGVMMIEGIVPKSLRKWFGVVKTAVIDRSDSHVCDEEYRCSLVDEEDPEEKDSSWLHA